MKRFFTILAGLLFVCATAISDSTPQEKYISKYSKLAISEMQRTGVPASITLAQGLIESGAGQSTLASKGNNHFGIKCHKGWTGDSMRLDDDAPNECFRVYKRVEDSFIDHSNFLRYYDRYKFLFDYEITDYKAWARGLKKAGYATDPKYADKLIATIEKYNLTRFDSGKNIPVSPNTLEEAKAIVYKESFEFSASVPKFEKNGVEFVYASEGDTYKSIAKSRDLFLGEILSFNDLKKSRELLPGEVVYVARKKKRTAKGLEMHIVGEEPETLWEICQRYGVRMSAVRDRNHFAKDYEVQEGDVILLR